MTYNNNYKKRFITTATRTTSEHHTRSYSDAPAANKLISINLTAYNAPFRTDYKYFFALGF